MEFESRRRGYDNSMIEIIPHLYISDWKSANDDNLLQSFNITSIVNASKMKDHASITTLHIEIDDFESCDISMWFSKANRFIYNGRLRGNVLVHCFAGRSRSPTLIISYLIHKHKIPYDTAFKLLRLRVPRLDINAGFVIQLKEYYYSSDTVVLELRQRKGDRLRQIIAEQLDITDL
jgi:protein-tyrosine phosphatase